MLGIPRGVQGACRDWGRGHVGGWEKVKAEPHLSLIRISSYPEPETLNPKTATLNPKTEMLNSKH